MKKTTRRKLVLGRETVKSMVTELPVGRFQEIDGAARKQTTSMDCGCTEEHTGCSTVGNP